MKRTILILLLSGLVLSIFAFAHSVQARVAIGSRSDEVKAIQEILKSDPEIYPEGYVTGYFGSLTEKAIKKLQKRCGLPETGIVDEATEKCLFPVFEIKVVSPNGGEVWERNQIQTIQWDVIETTTPSSGGIKPYPFWKKASIDLFRRVAKTIPCPPGETCNIEETVFVRHIATVDLFDKVYSWNITNDIKNGKDYVIRISSGKGIIPIVLEKEVLKQEEIWPVPPKPTWIKWDESDRTFEITGEITPECPTCPVCPNSEEIIASLTRIIEELQKLIASLRTSR